jgi:hypothetical protein
LESLPACHRIAEGNLEASPVFSTGRLGRSKVLLQDWGICSRPVEFGQPLGRKPGKGLVLMQDHQARGDPAEEGIEGHDEARIVVCHGRESPADMNLQFELFPNFPLQAILWPLPFMDLPAGELPLERQAHSLTPLRREHPPVLLDESAGHINVSHFGSDYSMVRMN